MNEQELAEIKARCEKATPGPWQPIDPADFDNQNPGWDVNGPYTIFDSDGYGFLDEHTAHFIAHAQQDIPALLAEVERLTAENARLRAALAHYAHRGHWSIRRGLYDVYDYLNNNGWQVADEAMKGGGEG